jgi:hypothetical protein
MIVILVVPFVFLIASIFTYENDTTTE